MRAGGLPFSSFLFMHNIQCADIWIRSTSAAISIELSRRTVYMVGVCDAAGSNASRKEVVPHNLIYI